MSKDARAYLGPDFYIDYNESSKGFDFNHETNGVYLSLDSSGEIEFKSTTRFKTDSLVHGHNPSDTITESTNPKGFDFTGDTGRDLHDKSVVTISNSSSSSVSETITVELYDGTDTTGTLLTSESKSVSVSANSSATATFITGDVALDNGTYHVNVTQSGTTLSIDQTDEHTKGAVHEFGQSNTGDLYVRDQDGSDKFRVNSTGPVEVTNANLNVGADIRTTDTYFDIRTDGSANGRVGLYDTANSQHLLKANEGGPVEVLNANLELPTGGKILGANGAEVNPNNGGSNDSLSITTAGTGSSLIHAYDKANSQQLMVWNEGGPVEVLDHLKIGGGSNTYFHDGGGTRQFYLSHDTTNDALRFGDDTNGYDLLRLNGGGPVEVLNAHTKIGGNTTQYSHQLRFNTTQGEQAYIQNNNGEMQGVDSASNSTTLT